MWDPTTDAHLSQTYRASDISGKRACKAALQKELGLPANPDVPLIGYVSRITHQKMADVILSTIPWIAELDAQLAIVGEGDPALETQFAQTQDRYGDRITVTIGYDELLAHRLQAGCDILLAPARFEPCGLTQLYALRYGTLPVVRRTGGLADTVVDATSQTIADRTATGFIFEDTSLTGLQSAISRALALYREPLTWRRLQLQAMAQDFSWDASAAKYISLYREVGGASLKTLVEEKRAGLSAQETARQVAI